MFYRTIRMLTNGIKPVFVFDGKPPDLKSNEVKLSPSMLKLCNCLLSASVLLYSLICPSGSYASHLEVSLR